MSETEVEVVVVGAGAAGLWAAGAVARGGRDVLVLEKTARAGSKILASGGTRCNLTTTLGPREAARLFGDGETFIRPALSALTPAQVRARFHDLGVPTVEEPDLEKVFPASQKAADVRNALVRAAVLSGANIRYGVGVQSIARAPRGWRVDCGAMAVRCRHLLVCPGGKSYPKTGTTGDGYRWLEDLGLSVVPPVPALVPLRSESTWVRELSGVALQDVEARLLDPSGRTLDRRRRPVLFTHHGLSGPGAMDLSARVARAEAEGRASRWQLALDLFPDRALDEVRSSLFDVPVGVHFGRVSGIASIPGRVLVAALRQAGIRDDNPVLATVEKGARHRLADALKGLRVPLSGTLGWDKAEVTAGGLALDQVERTTMAVRGRPGLYVFGELLDLTGPIGGLNFQAAFSTAELAAQSVLSS